MVAGSSPVHSATLPPAALRPPDPSSDEVLQGIRDRAHGFIAWIIVVLICIPFALWGVQEYLGPDPNVAIAEVDGEEISLFEYQRALQATRASLRRQFQGRDVSRIFGESLVREQAMDGLIRDRLIVQAASEAGFTISDEQLAGAIRSFPAFQRDGAFSAEEYEFALRRAGFAPGRFEADTRRQLLEGQWRNAIESSAIAAEGRARRITALDSQKRVFSRLVVPAARFETAEVGEEEIAKHYEENKADFVSSEELRLRYLVLAREDLAAEVEISPGTLEDHYESRKASFTVPEQRRVSHILIADEEGGEDARARAEALRARILGGEAFEEVAREASEDPGSAGSGGDLGYGGRGIWVPPFEKAAFSLAIGELSEPVQSEFGFHLIRVADVREARTRTFDEAREALEEEYRGEQADQLYFEQVERLSSLVFEQPDNLDDAADLLGLAVEESGWLTRAGEPDDEVLGDPSVIAAAFDEDVLAGNNSEPVELEGYRTVVVRVEERREPRQRTLDEVRSAIVARLQADRAREAARELGVALLGRLRVGGAMDAVAGDLAWSEPRTVDRHESAVGPAVRGVLFGMPRPDEGGTVYDGVADADGDFVLIALHRVVEDAGEDDAESLREVRDRLSRSSGRDAYAAFGAALRERSEIRIHEDRITADGSQGG